MADNCFQVWHCSVNEFVLFCGRLTVSFLPFISSPFLSLSLCLSLFLSLTLSLSNSHISFFDFLLPLFSCYLASIFTLSLALSTPSFSLSSQSFSLLSLIFHILCCGGHFYIFALLVPFLCFVCSLSANNKGLLCFFSVCSSQHIVDFNSLIH